MSEKNEVVNTKKTLTATERLDAIEQGFRLLDNGIGDLARNAEMMRQALKLMDNKVNSMVKALNEGKPLTEEVLDGIMKDNAALELKQKVEDLKAKGDLVDAETVEKESFLALKEIDPANGSVTNPRFQAPLMMLSQDVQDLLVGKKVGDVVDPGNNRYQIQVLEIYKIVTKTAEASMTQETFVGEDDESVKEEVKTEPTSS